MAAHTGKFSRLPPTEQEKANELADMFPELSEEDVLRLLEQYSGDMTQIVDKLLLQQSPSPPKANTATITPMPKSTNPNEINQTPISAISGDSKADIAASTQDPSLYPQSRLSNVSGNSLWGPEKPQTSPPKSFPSAFRPSSSPTTTEPLNLLESYSSPIPITKVPYTATQEVQSAEQFVPPSPVARSISPPSLPSASPSSTLSPESTTTSMKIGTPTSSNSIPSATSFGMPIVSHVNPVVTPIQSQSHLNSNSSVGSTSNLIQDIRPPVSPIFTNNSSLGLAHSPSTHSPGYLSSNPRVELFPSLYGSPQGSGTPNGQHGTVRSENGSMLSSLSASRINEERSLRIRTAEAQLHALMASMSELDQSNQQEMDLKDERIAQLEAELSALAREKSTWVHTLEKVNASNTQLRDQLAQQSQMIEMLAEQVTRRDTHIAQLQAKILSYRPIEGAEQFREALEASLQAAIPTQREDLTRAMADFASAFQRALAASLLEPLNPK